MLALAGQSLAAAVRYLRSPAVTAAVLLALAFVMGALPWLSGDDPAQTVLRARSAEREPDPAAMASIRAELAIPDNPVTGTVDWLAGAIRGNFGVSWVTGKPVTPSVAGALGVSVTLAVLASLICLAVAVTVLAPSLWRATRTGQPTARGATIVGAALAATPEFLLAAVLLAVVAVRWRLAPTSGWVGPENALLPALALGLPAAGLLSRVLSGALDTTVAEGWVRTWWAAGFSRVALARAVLRRAVAVALPQVLLLLIGLLGAAVVVEAVFAIPGLGATALRATLAQDLPLVQACVAVLVLLGLALGGTGIAAHRLLMGPALHGTGLAPAAPVRVATASRLPVTLLAVLLAVVGLGLLRDPGAVMLTGRLQPPSLDHPLGTDALGRDLLARFGHGALLSVGTAIAVSALVLVVGLAVGLARERARAGVADVLNALPPVLVGILVGAVTGPGISSAAVAVCLVAWIPLAVHSRTLAAEVRASGFLEAAVAGGADRRWILRRHLLPSVFPAVARHALLRVPHNALALAGLSFIGLGAAPDSPEWGRVLAESISYIERAPWNAAAPAIGLALLGVIASLLRTER